MRLPPGIQAFTAVFQKGADLVELTRHRNGEQVGTDTIVPEWESVRRDCCHDCRGAGVTLEAP